MTEQERIVYFLDLVLGSLSSVSNNLGFGLADGKSLDRLIEKNPEFEAEYRKAVEVSTKINGIFGELTEMHEKITS